MPLLIPTFFLRRKTQLQHMRQGPKHDLPFLMQAWLPSPSLTGYSRWRPSIVSKHVHVQDKLPLPSFSPSSLTEFNELKSELVEFLQDFEKEKKVCHCVAMATKQ